MELLILLFGAILFVISFWAGFVYGKNKKEKK
jgi:hypothetical protein